MSVPISKAFLLMLGVMILLSCREAPPPVKEAGFVEANSAYRQHFGDPPPVRSGRAYARVAFLPLRDAPGKVRAVPLFLFDDDRQLAKIIDRLAGGELRHPPGSSLYNPFPEESRVAALLVAAGVVTINLEMPDDRSVDLPAVADSLVETAAQFGAVDRVVIERNGRPLAGMPAGGYRPDPGRIAPVGPPDLIMLVGVWDEGSDAPEEIHASFDRPVTVGAFRLASREGDPIAGDLFTSIFDMAVVLHPENPQFFREGLPLRIEWEVTDALGRTGRGAQTLPLQHYLHKTVNGDFREK